MTSHSGNFSAGSLTSPKASYSWRRECSPSHSPHSSRDGACNSPTMGEASKKSFSSSSLTGHGYYYTYPKVSFNRDLLTPLQLDVDPALQEIRTKEKEDLKMLNDQFAALIGKVQSLEQHNQVLVTRWNFLKEQDNSLSDFDIKLLYDRYMNKLNLEMRSIDAEKEQLDSELDEVHSCMDSFRSKYEEEINKRTGMEFTFTTLKKDLDNGFLHKTELETKLSGLHAWVELMCTIHEQELDEVMSQVKDISVVLGIDNNRYIPDPHQIVEDVRAQYEDLAMKSWEELEALTRSKLNEREVLCAKYGDHLLNDRRMIAELNIQIQKLRSCITCLKSQCLHLEDNIKDVGQQGEASLNDAKAKLAKLEDALYNARQDLAQLVKEYQELMSTKLALDIEILTYRKLVEGEEISMESPSPAFISKIYSRPKSFLSNSGITNVPDVASGAKDLTNKMIHSGSSLVTGLSRSHNENEVLTETIFARTHSEPRDNIQEGSDFGSPSHRSAELLSSKFSRTQSGESSNSSGRRYYSSRKESVPVGYQSQSQGSREFTENAFGRSLCDDISEDSLFRSYSGTSASYIEGWLSRSQSDENECRNVHGNEGYAEPTVSTTTSAEDDGLPEGGISGTYREMNRDISEVSLSRSQNDEPESRGSHEKIAEPVLSRTRSTEDGGVPVGGISESSSKANRNTGSSLGDFSQIQRDQSQDSTDTIFSQGHTEGTQESNPHNYPSGSNTAYVEGSSVSGSLSGEKKSVSKGGGFRTPSIRNTTLSDSVFIRTPTSVVEDLCEGTDLKNHSKARESALETNISGDPSPRSEELSLPELSRLHTTENRGIPGNNNPSRFVYGRKSNSESGLSKSYTNRKGGLTQSVFARPHSVPDKSDYSSSQIDGSEGFVKAVVSRINRSILEGGSSRGQSSRRGAVAVDVMKDQSKEIKGDTTFPDYDVRNANETKEVLSQSGPSRTELEQAGSFSRNLGDNISPVKTSTPIHLHRKKEDAAEYSFSRSHSEESGSFKAADFLSRSSNEENGDIQEANVSTSCDKENEKCTEGVISRNHSYKCAVTSHSRTKSDKAKDVLERGRSHNSESGRLSPSGIYKGQSGEREDQSEVALSRSYSNTDEVAVENPYISHDNRNE